MNTVDSAYYGRDGSCRRWSWPAMGWIWGTDKSRGCADAPHPSCETAPQVWEGAKNPTYVLAEPRVSYRTPKGDAGRDGYVVGRGAALAPGDPVVHGIGSRLGYCPGCSRHDREVSMNPWQLIGRAQTPGGGAELVLYQRDSEFSLKADNLELMNSRVYGSEEAMARLGCQNLAKRPRARVLIGGLGMGYSVRTALDILGEDARVVVAELVPAVVEWNRGVLADLAGRPLDDRRTELREADVVQLITATRLERIKNFRIAVRSSILIPCGLLL